MSCSICYEEFIDVRDYSIEEMKMMIEEKYAAIRGGDLSPENVEKFCEFNSLLTKPHICPTPNCNKKFCKSCYNKIKREDPGDPYGKPKLFKCSFCRIVNIKDYMKNNVLPNLQYKVMGPEKFIGDIFVLTD